MDDNYLDLAADMIIFITGLSLLCSVADSLYQILEEMTISLIR